MDNVIQKIYGFRTRLKGFSPSTFKMVYEDKKDLIDFITKKDIIIKGSTFKKIEENLYLEVPDDENVLEKRSLDIFELELHKTNK